jgi:hypothetical protein
MATFQPSLKDCAGREHVQRKPNGAGNAQLQVPAGRQFDALVCTAQIATATIAAKSAMNRIPERL